VNRGTSSFLIFIMYVRTIGCKDYVFSSFARRSDEVAFCGFACGWLSTPGMHVRACAYSYVMSFGNCTYARALKYSEALSARGPLSLPYVPYSTVQACCVLRRVKCSQNVRSVGES